MIVLSSSRAHKLSTFWVLDAVQLRIRARAIQTCIRLWAESWVDSEFLDFLMNLSWVGVIILKRWLSRELIQVNICRSAWVLSHESWEDELESTWVMTQLGVEYKSDYISELYIILYPTWPDYTDLYIHIISTLSWVMTQLSPIFTWVGVESESLH